eukprot:jgi/Tetstr1/433567/TSEL_022834.t1
MEPPQPIPGAQQDFADRVRRHFADLASRGLGANEAAAVAIQIASGIVKPPAPIEVILHLMTQSNGASGKCDEQLLVEACSHLFSSAETLSISLLHDPRQEEEAGSNGNAHATSATRGCAEIESLHSFYAGLSAANSDRIMDIVMDGSKMILRQLSQPDVLAAMPGGSLCISMTISAVLCNPALDKPDHSEMVPNLGRIAMDSADSCRELLIPQTVDQEIESTTQLLELLYEANERSRAISYELFYNDAVNSDDFNILEDYKKWKSPRQSFSFCAHPFVYDPASKSRLLTLENDRAMYHEFQDALLRSVLVNATCPYFILRVRRSPHLVHDTLRQVEGAIATDSLKKPLRVQFIGEEGVDEGGVTKEFFQLLLRDIFDPDYGMFQYDRDTCLHWFRPSTLVDQEQEFKLVGVMIGLAIYNSQLLELNFPLVLYKKLMGGVPTLEDLKELSPEIFQSLKELMEHTGDVESDFCLTFQIEYETGFGELSSISLGTYNGDTPVTNLNREEFVKLYVKNLLSDRVELQYEAFSKGFHTMCSGPALRMFRAEELESLICGSCSLNFDELERHTVYESGFTRESPSIANFWRVVHGFSEEQKRLFLSFVTGSGRVPIKGLSDLHPPFTITKNGPHSERLPTAHTCFNTLLLPTYGDADTLERCLLTAINNAEGFGLM